jgi:hypothetical protein
VDTTETVDTTTALTMTARTHIPPRTRVRNTEAAIGCRLDADKAAAERVTTAGFCRDGLR